MGRFLLFTLCLASFSLFTGCISLSRSEKEDMRVLKSAGIDPAEKIVKHVAVAGLLNILPGFGNFYLSIKSDEPNQALVGILNLLLWPVSVLWAVAEGATDARTLNRRETVYYYMRTEQGRSELNAALAKKSLPPNYEPLPHSLNSQNGDKATR